MKSPRDPAEKKRLSYERDGVNLYGENDKSSRKAIPAFKAASNRRMRRTENEVVEKLATADGDSADGALADLTFRGLHPWKRKSPDARLGVALLAEGKGGESQRRALSGRNLRQAVEADLNWRRRDLALDAVKDVKANDE